ncbi:MAG: hypothetical protein Kow00129_05240 [Thermoleophilia bacterium]
MWVCVHMLTGAAAGRLLRRLGLTGPLLPLTGPVLHAALDRAPHWDYTALHRRLLWSALDVGTATSLLVQGHRRGLETSVLAAGLLSAAPDLDVAGEAFAGSRRVTAPRRRLFPSHRPGFAHGETQFWPGLAVQGVAVAVSLLILARSRPEISRTRRRARNAASKP